MLSPLPLRVHVPLASSKSAEPLTAGAPMSWLVQGAAGGPAAAGRSGVSTNIARGRNQGKRGCDLISLSVPPSDRGPPAGSGVAFTFHCFPAHPSTEAAGSNGDLLHRPRSGFLPNETNDIPTSARKTAVSESNLPVVATRAPSAM